MSTPSINEERRVSFSPKMLADVRRPDLPWLPEALAQLSGGIWEGYRLNFAGTGKSESAEWISIDHADLGAFHILVGANGSIHCIDWVELQREDERWAIWCALGVEHDETEGFSPGMLVDAAAEQHADVPWLPGALQSCDGGHWESRYYVRFATRREDSPNYVSGTVVVHHRKLGMFAIDLTPDNRIFGIECVERKYRDFP